MHLDVFLKTSNYFLLIVQIQDYLCQQKEALLSFHLIHSITLPTSIF